MDVPYIHLRDIWLVSDDGYESIVVGRHSATEEDIWRYRQWDSDAAEWVTLDEGDLQVDLRNPVRLIVFEGELGLWVGDEHVVSLYRVFGEPSWVTFYLSRGAEYSGIRVWVEEPSSPGEALLTRVRGGVVKVEANRGSQGWWRGSGFIFAFEPNAAFVVTNHHVIDGASELLVDIYGEPYSEVRLLGANSETDTAVLSVCGINVAPHTVLGHGRPSVGDMVMAAGYPAGSFYASRGDVQQPDVDGFIKSTAAVNPGNSGGPLFSMQGHVVGLNTQRRYDRQGDLSFYAVPYTTIAEQVEEWRRGHVSCE